MIKALYSYYIPVVLLKEDPENTPYSRWLMVLSALIFILVMIVQWRLSAVDFSDDLAYTIMASVSLVFSFFIYTYGILYFRMMSPRWVQTLTCLYFSHIFIHFLAIPLCLMDAYLVDAKLKNPLILLVGVIYLLSTLALSVWQFVVTAHIYKHALGATAVQSVLAAFGLFAANILTVSFWR